MIASIFFVIFSLLAFCWTDQKVFLKKKPVFYILLIWKLRTVYGLDLKCPTKAPHWKGRLFRRGWSLDTDVGGCSWLSPSRSACWPLWVKHLLLCHSFLPSCLWLGAANYGLKLHQNKSLCLEDAG